jgi:hypothetical protein
MEPVGRNRGGNPSGADVQGGGGTCQVVLPLRLQAVIQLRMAFSGRDAICSVVKENVFTPFGEAVK